MKLFFYEFRKLFFHNKGWLIFLVLIVSQFVISGFGNKDYNFQTEQYKLQYQNYLIEFGGHVDDDKIKALNKEEKRIARVEEEALSLFRRLNEGQITPAEYDTESEKYNDIFEQKMAFMQIQNQYDYAEQDPAHRFVMYENGWYTAMQENSPNYILIFCVILLTTRCFCPEYETEMYGIIFCTKNGREKTFQAKTLVLFFSIIVCGLITALVTLATAQIKFGLCFASYPIQSLRHFSVCEYNLTVWQCFALIWILKMIGLYIIGVITALICILLNKSMPSFFVGGIISILPYFIFNLNSIVQFVPHLGLSLSGYYFSGLEYTSSETGEYLTEAVPMFYLFITCVTGIAASIICIWLSFIVWSHRRLKRE